MRGVCFPQVFEFEFVRWVRRVIDFNEHTDDPPSALFRSLRNQGHLHKRASEL